MKDKTIIYKTTYLTVASGADQTFEIPSGLGCHFYLQFGNITGLTCSLTVSYDGGTQYVNIVSVTSAGTAVAAGGTITTADGLKVHFDAEGATHVKVTYVGGTDGPVRLVGTDSADALIAARLLQLIASGITVNSDTGYADDGTGFTVATSEVQVIGALADETSTDSVDEGDVGAVRMTLDRRLRVANKALDGAALTSLDSYGSVAINLTTGANQVLVSSAAGKQIWVYGFGISVGDADGQTVSFQDEDDVALSGIMEFAQYGGAVANPSGNLLMPLWKLGTDKDLEVDVTGGDVDGWLVYGIWTV